jgi:hypothetical protein
MAISSLRRSDPVKLISLDRYSSKEYITLQLCQVDDPTTFVSKAEMAYNSIVGVRIIL